MTASLMPPIHPSEVLIETEKDRPHAEIDVGRALGSA